MSRGHVAWQRSTFCSRNGCVEVLHHDGHVRVRSSRRPDEKPTVLDADEWRAFLLGVKAGEFDVPGGTS